MVPRTALLIFIKTVKSAVLALRSAALNYGRLLEAQYICPNIPVFHISGDRGVNLPKPKWFDG